MINYKIKVCLFLLNCFWGYFSVTSEQPSLLRVVKNPRIQHGIEMVPGSQNLFSSQQECQKIRALFLNNAKEFLTCNEAKFDLIRSELSKTDKIGKSLLDYSNQNPLGLIRECTTFWCPLNRLKFPYRREWVEEKIVSDVQKRFPDKKKRLAVSFFAPGDLMTELIISTELIKCGYHNLVVNLVGYGMKKYVDSLKELGEKVPLEVYRNNSDEKIFINVHNYRLAQFVQWLKRYSDHVSVVLYPGAESYQQACDIDPSCMSEISIGIDIFEGDDVMKLVCPYLFLWMNLKTLTQNGVAYTSSRHPIFSSSEGRSFFSRILDKLFLGFYGCGIQLAPPLELLDKKRQLTKEEAEQIQKECASELKKSPIWGILDALEILKKRTKNSLVATHIHQLETKCIAVTLAVAGVASGAAVMGIGYFIRKTLF